MNQHTYLRAYIAGIAVPTLALPIGVTVFGVARYAYNFSLPLERVMIFPMAVVPLLWGLWNVLFVASHSRTHLPIGFHGAILPFILGPLGIFLTRALDFQLPNFGSHYFPILAPVAVIAYYLAWKYFVGFLNTVLGIA